ncbi:hypothetical protein [Vibrio cincinnatiensis]|uniref:hypothetical protein n=1 Tax=Vibrio cincinnatiensis TaxID=675 RepID=UPI001EE0FBC8|nr:hypothetical protein [Vibrio cincinnatiensis]
METIITAVITASATGIVAGIASSYATVIALKTDMHWLKKLFDNLDERVCELEKQG